MDINVVIAFLVGVAVALLVTVPRIVRYGRQLDYGVRYNAAVRPLPNWREKRAFGRLPWDEQRQVAAFVAFKDMVSTARRTHSINIRAHEEADNANRKTVPRDSDGWSVGPMFPFPDPRPPYDEDVLKGRLPPVPQG